MQKELCSNTSKSFVYFGETPTRLQSTPYSCEYLRGLTPNPDEVRRSVDGLGKTTFFPEVFSNPRVHRACPVTADFIVVYIVFTSRPRASTLQIMGQVFVLMWRNTLSNAWEERGTSILVRGPWTNTRSTYHSTNGFPEYSIR